MGRILYITDRFKVSDGYQPAFGHMVKKAGIKREEILVTDIYNLVQDPLIHKGNEKIWRYNPEKLEAIRAAFDQRIRTVRPTLVVVSCPAVLGVLSGGDWAASTLEKMRGGVYTYQGLTCIVTYPITAINQRIDERLVENEDGEVDRQEPYKVKSGARILAWDWQKVGRFHNGRQRKTPPFSYSVCRTREDLISARDFLGECALIGLDIETGNFPPQITCIGYAGLLRNGAIHSFVIPFADEFADDGVFWEDEWDHEFAWQIVEEINSNDVPKTMQNGAYDSAYLIRDMAPPNQWLYDSMLIWWSKFMEFDKDLAFISSILLDDYQYWKDDIKGQEIDEQGIGRKALNLEKYWRYNALDCRNTLLDTLYLLAMMRADADMQRVYQDVYMRCLSGLGMSLRGVKADFRRRDWHKKNLESDRDTAVVDLQYMLADSDFNYNSPKQKSALLYDFMGLRPRNDRGRFINPNKPLTGINAPSSGAIPLKLAKTEHPLFRKIIEQMESAMTPDKQISNVCNMKVYSDRFRCSYSAAGTTTTRFSTKGSAFWDCASTQNIRKDYRDWFVADPDHIFLDVDYSQSDDVFVSYESQDPDKIALVESGKDGHAVHGELFFGTPYHEIVDGKDRKDPKIVHPVKGIRQIAKRVVHGTNFQMAAMTLYVTMGREAVVAAAELLGFKDAQSWDQDKLVMLCQGFMNKYRKRYRRLNKNEWYKEIAQDLISKGKITNAFGITRNFFGDPKDNGTQREATGFIGQSDTAGNMNRVMYEIDHGWIPKRFRDGENPDYGDTPRCMDWHSHGFAFHIQVHDNFVGQLNTKHPRFLEAATNLLYVMNRPVIIHGRTARIKAEAELGVRWGNSLVSWDGNIETFESCVIKVQAKEAKLRKEMADA